MKKARQFLQSLFFWGNQPASRQDTDHARSPYAGAPIFDLVREVERMAKIGFWRLDAISNEVFWSPEIIAIHDLEHAPEIDLGNALNFFPGDHRVQLEAAVERALKEAVPYELELDFVSALGVEKRVRALGKPQAKDGRVVALVGVFQDITSSYRMEQRLQKMAHSDALTGLANRRHLEAYFRREGLSGRCGSGGAFACAIIDLDHFKQINDTSGHSTGDAVLLSTARRLGADWLHNSLPVRLGGDEFLLLIRDPALLADLPATTQRLLDELAQDVSTAAGEVAISASIGMVCFDEGSFDLDQVLHCADTVLYSAKETRRGSARIAKPDDLFIELPPIQESVRKVA